MKIAQIMAGAPNGGAELFYERMTLALAAAGDEILPVIRTDPRRHDMMLQAGLNPVQFRFGGPFDILTKPRLRKTLETFKADVAIAWMSRAAYHAPRGDWTLIGRLGGYYNLKYFRSCQHLVGNTRAIVRWIVDQGWPRERVHYLPNFVDDYADTAPVSRATLGVPAHANLLLALGRLHKVKGFDTLIETMALLPDIHCIIAGEGPERAALQRLIEHHNLAHRVKLLGWRNDSGALLKAADIFISSSRHEPLGNMVLEAFSGTTPVIAAKAEGPAEIIRDGNDGMLVPIDDAPALAAAITSLLAHPVQAAARAAAGRKRFETEFSKTTVLAAWHTLLHQVRP